jgi:hypothetical protein
LICRRIDVLSRKVDKAQSNRENREPRKRRREKNKIEELPGKVLVDFFGKHCRTVHEVRIKYV